MGIAQDLETNVNRIINSGWDLREGRKVPGTDEVALDGGGVVLDATVLYADLSESSKLATDFHRQTAAKVIKCFLYCAARIIASHEGSISAFDGDRVMGVFVGDAKNTSSATSALQINYVVLKIIKPRLIEHFASVRDSGFEIRHGVGVDTSSILAVRAGVRGSNDLVWVGRAPNLAARLSSIREDVYASYITDEVFQRLRDEAKMGGNPPQLMWEPRSYEWVGDKWSIHRSKWYWEP